ncbi:MarR family transcriptional regulator [Actinorhabdospora filicis]|uniref:MarR family transcriptional regulator n=1 Tax=Actinorhabdospora filicis TaxID=1785913 RepID=A0A9W6SL84_9ACTN|nr:MarR family winged helix-turn-helix transcriptional regulator [Actinorhabdospora filicis]GLZ79030.1 MarR family transcriptional regulator [Actinorhabdospora filicis]
MDHDALAADVSRLMRDMVLLLRQATADLDVSPPQLAVLGSLLGGPRRMGDLAAEHGVRMPTMTVQVNRMERDGLVERGRDTADARVVTASLTDTGRAALAAGRGRRNAFLAGRLAALSPEDREAIALAIPALRLLVQGAPEE